MSEQLFELFRRNILQGIRQVHVNASQNHFVSIGGVVVFIGHNWYVFGLEAKFHADDGLHLRATAFRAARSTQDFFGADPNSSQLSPRLFRDRLFAIFLRPKEAILSQKTAVAKRPEYFLRQTGNARDEEWEVRSSKRGKLLLIDFHEIGMTPPFHEQIRTKPGDSARIFRIRDTEKFVHGSLNPSIEFDGWQSP